MSSTDYSSQDDIETNDATDDMSASVSSEETTADAIAEDADSQTLVLVESQSYGLTDRPHG